LLGIFFDIDFSEASQQAQASSELQLAIKWATYASDWGAIYNQQEDF
jgi:hypothetical protein